MDSYVLMQRWFTNQRNQRCVRSQKSGNLPCTAVEAGHLAWIHAVENKDLRRVVVKVTLNHLSPQKVEKFFLIAEKLLTSQKRLYVMLLIN